MAGYTVLAIRYRPRTFEEVAGQGDVARVLHAAIRDGRAGHAFLFSGPRGVGKTSMARILAKAFNCLDSTDGLPCGACNVCKAIDGAGDCLDVVEIDGASHNKVENVRDLIENLRFRPVEARYRIYIVDEVHMLSTAAFNALLKTLEEPPEHAKFILATTEPLKVPETIRSRCQMFDFRRLTADVIAGHLARICEQEGVAVPDGLLERVARHANGGMRDALTLLDQLITFGEGTPSVEDFERLTGRLPPELLESLVRSALAGSVDEVVRGAGDALGRGARPADLLGQLTDLVEGVLVAAAGGEPADRTPEERAALSELAGATQVDHLVAMLDVLVEAAERLKRRHDGRLVVEMALITWARLAHLQPVADLLAGAPPPEPRAAPTPTRREPPREDARPAARSAAPTSAPSRDDDAAAAAGWPAEGGGSTSDRRAKPSGGGRSQAAPPAAPPSEPAAPADFRARFLEALPTRSLRLELTRYPRVSVEGDALVLGLPPDGPSPLYDPTSDKALARQLVEVASGIEGRPLSLRVGRGAGGGGPGSGGGGSGGASPAPRAGSGGGGIQKAVEDQWPGAERVDF